MAATLASSLLGHVLFLKGQVPFPVVQLARMPGGQSNSRGARRRHDLLVAFDTLSSHLQTTFSALSAAIALRRAGAPSDASAHLAFVVGPSVGAARARVVFIVDGLEVRPWGERDAGPSVFTGTRGEDVESAEDTDEESDEDDSGNDETDEESDDDSEKEESESEGDNSDDAQSVYFSEDESEPPPSRTPSPSPLSSKDVSRPPSPSLCHSAPTNSAGSHISTQNTSPQPQTYAEEQQTLRAAERLLSRTLANACAEEGGGMSAELAPTQTHILLRAPRCFKHPAWIPRQNLTRSLEGILQAFLEESGCAERSPKGKTKAIRGIKTEGVYVGCRGSAASEDKEDQEEEDDEMIWWVWDGKITGFSDW
ncbi:hypothetical protein IEO21_03605 [Rhodonia placenta]|uniref:Uncharacterized protein n=1 Tax=Rhodonia placenta TaxID=104341 RepID=A0A8H7P5D5_9APHY|nr:hypothetical protein IEO21_03605 [Postia placenta]